MRLILAALAVSVSVSATRAGDLGIDLNSLEPCKPAAARYCDRSTGITMAGLMRCGAALAAVSDRVGDRCRRVLRQYGQL